MLAARAFSACEEGCTAEQPNGSGVADHARIRHNATVIDSNSKLRLGIVGGSGLYQLASLAKADWVTIDTPFGPASDALLHGFLGETECVFLPRHGRGHTKAPHEINYRANIAALKIAGCTHILAISACGSFRKKLSPGTFVVVDQFRDFTRARANSFFGDGIVAHIGFGHPTCAALSRTAEDALVACDIPHRVGATYAIIEGPRFSTAAESHAMRASGCDLVGMTGLPEACLAREAELHYAAVAMVTDYDAWHPEAAHVDVASVIAVVHANAAAAARLVTEVAARLPAITACFTGCAYALDGAVITARERWPDAIVAKLDAVAGRVLTA